MSRRSLSRCGRTRARTTAAARSRCSRSSANSSIVLPSSQLPLRLARRGHESGHRRVQLQPEAVARHRPLGACARALRSHPSSARRTCVGRQRFDLREQRLEVRSCSLTHEHRRARRSHRAVAAGTPVRGGHHHGALDVRMLFERRLDLSWLDPVAAQLELVVLASQELQHPIASPARAVTRAIERGFVPTTGRSHVDEPLARSAPRARDTPAQVLRRRGTALPRGRPAAAAGGRRARRRAAFGIGRPIGTVVAVTVVPRAGMDRCPHRDLGRPVLVEERNRGQPLVVERDELRRTGFAGDDDAPQRLEIAGARAGGPPGRAPGCRGGRTRADRESRRQSLAGSRRSSTSATTSVPPSASVQKIPATELSKEKLGRSRKRAGAFAVVADPRLRGMEEVPVGHDHAFGIARGPGGVDHICRLLRIAMRAAVMAVVRRAVADRRQAPCSGRARRCAGGARTW